MRVLVAGATGYVGSRLVPKLLAAGHEVVCLVRDPARLGGETWQSRVEIHRGDLMDPETLPPAAAGCDVAYYLVHSMGRKGDFAAAEAECAENFRLAATSAGIGSIVYLGGLGGDNGLSRHLSSRHAVGRILARGRVPVIELRAAVVIGAGSLSFEMLRYLTEVLPVMTTPRWVRTRCQPIAIEDLLEILLASAGPAPPGGSVFEIGGPDVLTYEQMMRIYAEEAGLRKRLIIPVPVLSPGLSSLWVGLVTPLPAAIARPLIGSLRNEVVVHADRTGAPGPVPRTRFRAAVRSALLSRVGPEAPAAEHIAAARRPSDPRWAGGTEYVDRRTAFSPASSDALARAFTRIGGDNGYYGADWAWSFRGLVDLVLGGPGRKRARRNPDALSPGDELDFWRVASVEPGHRLLLEAEMKMPGRAWLEFIAEQHHAGSLLVQTAYFRPRGLAGRLYWAMLLPLHKVLFDRMARRIAAAAIGP